MDPLTIDGVEVTEGQRVLWHLVSGASGALRNGSYRARAGKWDESLPDPKPRNRHERRAQMASRRAGK